MMINSIKLLFYYLKLYQMDTVQIKLMRPNIEEQEDFWLNIIAIIVIMSLTKKWSTQRIILLR